MTLAAAAYIPLDVWGFLTSNDLGGITVLGIVVVVIQLFGHVGMSARFGRLALKVDGVRAEVDAVAGQVNGRPVGDPTLHDKIDALIVGQGEMTRQQAEVLVRVAALEGRATDAEARIQGLEAWAHRTDSLPGGRRATDPAA